MQRRTPVIQARSTLFFARTALLFARTALMYAKGLGHAPEDPLMQPRRGQRSFFQKMRRAFSSDTPWM